MKKTTLLTLMSIFMFILGGLCLYLSMVEMSACPFDGFQEATFKNMFGIIAMMLSKSFWLKAAIACYVISAFTDNIAYLVSFMVGIFMYTAWMYLVHMHIVFLPYMAKIYESGWYTISISQHFTVTAVAIAFILFAIAFAYSIVRHEKSLVKLVEDRYGRLYDYVSD